MSSLSTCRHCHRRYHVTDDLRKADAACPLCGQPLRKTMGEMNTEALHQYRQEKETEFKDDPHKDDIVDFYVESMALQLRQRMRRNL